MEEKTLSMDARPKVRYWLPGAAMTEEDLRQEIRDLAARGFGGIEAVVLQTVPAEILLSEDGWGGPNWDRMVDIMNDETSKLGMSLDLAAGPGWPIASPTVYNADDPAALCELTYGCMELRGGAQYDGPLPERRVIRCEGTPERVAVMAYRCDTSDPVKVAEAGTMEKTVFGERERRLPLLADSYVDLNGRVDGDRISWEVPGSPEERWMLFAFWRQPAVQKINGGRTYVVDHLSAEGARAVADYWDPVLSCHNYDAMESVFCDSLEYDVAMDWTRALPEIFKEERGYDVIPYLPFIGMINTFPAGDVPAFPSTPANVRYQVNNDYMEMLTRLYCRNHLQILEEMAEAHGKTVRYQVAYNKPFEEERCGLSVGIPENEALGRCQLDGQRLMAAAAHLGRKKRYSFECAAEFGQCYGQGYEDLMWWVKRSQMAGMNAQVLHGASYSGACIGSNPENSLAKGATWPGYEGFGKFVTNNWNRTPDAEHARGCMDAIARQNSVFRKHARVDLAIFRQAYENNGNGADFYLYDDDGALQNRGYSYEFVSDYLLRLPQAQVKDGELDREGPGYRALIVPPQERMSGSAMETFLKLSRQGLTVVLVGEAPVEALYYSESRTKEERGAWEVTRNRLWNAGKNRTEEGNRLIWAEDLARVPAALADCGIFPRAMLEEGGDVMTAVRRDEETGRIWYALYGYNRVHVGENATGPGDADPMDVKPFYHRPGRPSARVVKAALSGKGKVYFFDPWSGRKYPLAFSYDGHGRMRGSLILEEDELALLCLEQGEDVCDFEGMPVGPQKENGRGKKAGTVCLEQFSFYSFGPDIPGETSFLRSSFSQEPIWTKHLEGEADLVPWREMDPSLEFAAGVGIYRGKLTVDTFPEKGERLVLCLGDVYDTFTVRVNGEKTLFPDQVMKRVDVTEFVRKGINTLEVRVASELHNQLVGRAKDGGVPGMPAPQYLPRDYGIMPSDMKPLELLMIN